MVDCGTGHHCGAEAPYAQRQAASTSYNASVVLADEGGCGAGTARGLITIGEGSANQDMQAANGLTKSISESWIEISIRPCLSYAARLALLDIHDSTFAKTKNVHLQWRKGRCVFRQRVLFHGLIGVIVDS